MKYNLLPGSDEKISALGLGTWNFCGQWNDQKDSQAVSVVHAALHGGINFIDTAPIYGKGHSEKILGQALKGRRHEVFIAGKCGLQWNAKGKVRHDLSRATLTQELEESLARLQCDYIDLLQVHWPNTKYPLEETITTLEGFRKAGKIRFIGVSNFSLEQLLEARQYAPIISYQGLFNILEQNASEYHRNPLNYRSMDEIIPQMEKLNMAFIPYSPLMQGFLSGRYSHKDQYKGDLRWSNSQIIDQAMMDYLPLVRELETLSKRFNYNLVSMVLRWTMEQPAVLSVIAGARTVNQMEKNIEGTGPALPDLLRTQLEKFIKGHRKMIYNK
ncbi:MAG: aldo/keto reductase [Spirochaetaceae bacterium]|jgi:aryl-alcohol dehydrogenase-like predicted oxidoreductase|nr:aldo/keto reductase [Spirochaetaceae bacterium]